MYAGTTGVATVISASHKRQLVGRVICRWDGDGRAFRRVRWLWLGPEKKSHRLGRLVELGCSVRQQRA